MSYRTIPVLPLEMNPGIEQGITAIKLTPQTLLMPAIKHILADAASGGVWIFRTTQRVSTNRVDRSTLGDIGNDIGIIEAHPPVMIGSIGTAPPCGLNLIQDVGDIWQSTSPGLVIQSQKLDAIIDGKLSNNQYSTSILSKLIGDKLSDGSSWDL